VLTAAHYDDDDDDDYAMTWHSQTITPIPSDLIFII